MNDKLTKNERRQQARENARLAQEAEKKREKRNRLMLQGGIVLVVLAVIGIVALVLTQTMKPAGPGPVNMVSGGVTFTTDLEVVETPALGEGEERVSRDIDFDALPVDVAIYVDYSCPGCGAFEQTYGEMLERYTGNGDINLTVYPVNFLDANSGTKYSTRAANLVSCVVEQQPEFAFALHNELLSANVQPGQNQPNWHTDEQLIEIAETVGVDPNTELKQCMKDQRFAGFISGNWKAASETGLLGLADGAVLYANPSTGELQNPDGPQRLVSTPTVIINGQQWNSATDGDLETYILKLIAENGGADEAAESAEDEAATE